MCRGNVLMITKAVHHRSVTHIFPSNLFGSFNYFPRLRHFWKNMDCDLLLPPCQVRGMKLLERNQFYKAIEVPYLLVSEENTQHVLALVKEFLLKMNKLSSVRVYNWKDKTGRQIILNPTSVKQWRDLPFEELKKENVDEKDFGFTEIELNYNNWTAYEIIKAVLPEEDEGLASYSLFGHICHLNLKDHLLPYKDLIGTVLLDKVSNCKTVVNKAATIDNTFRNFQLQLLCGEPRYEVKTKENGVVFEFDFSKVYWNPRLSTEHYRIVNFLRPGDVLYDVFAGVGPFSVPAAKKKCSVLANDLNPESFKWLQHNLKRNKCEKKVQIFNKDGKEFIQNDLKADLLKRWQQQDDEPKKYNIHITMNLPAMAVEFLSAFRGLYEQEFAKGLIDFERENIVYPRVHVYVFAKGSNTMELALQQVEDNLKMALNDQASVNFVRNVAPKKDMYRVSFYLTSKMLTQPITDEQEQGQKRKFQDSKMDEPSEVSQSKIPCS